MLSNFMICKALNPSQSYAIEKAKEEGKTKKDDGEQKG